MKSWINALTALLVLCLVSAGLTALAEGSGKTLLTIYEGPKTMRSSTDASVSVNGCDLFVYDVMVNHEHIWNANTMPTYTPMTYFDFEGKVTVRVQMPCLKDAVTEAEVLAGSGERGREERYSE